MHYVKRLLPGTQDWERVVYFSKNCTWQGDGRALSEMMQTLAFSDYESVFAAFAGQDPIGFCTITKTDYARLPFIEPWLGFLFVHESHRGSRIGQDLLRAAENYAGICSFKQVFLSAEHNGLYEKYGYQHYIHILGPKQEHLNIYRKEVLR